ncbi:MAG TPA: fumarylacetoacetate hydrolase family protein [Burkholderiales bacterium]|jgi:2-keto-4-pentenoate hydratase/2-oxohepta-3-ene-1,7-dioic acid hydratase in catechol pathway|nr:fumarylacetoacetate hydrolase family protein [Burkholderiales bacterium]
MHLITFSDSKGSRIGVLDRAAGKLTDLSVAAPDLPREMQAFIRLGTAGLAGAKAAAASGKGALSLDQVKLEAPIPRPAKNIMCVGKNYHEHAKEFHNSGFDASAGANAVPELPIIFTKAPTSVIAQREAIDSSLDHTNSVDYEGELTVVIGTGGRGIKKADAFKHVYGYTIINDVTARTMQHAHKQWFLGKSIDTFCPMGPTIVTADEVADVTKLRLVTRVNGEVRQDAMVSDLIFDVPTLIETLSRTMTLEPGDLIATGTCAGVGIGFKPPKFMKKGDVVAVTIEPIGTLENPVA